VLSIITSFLEKSAPIVGFECALTLELIYYYKRVVFPTPESPNITIFKKFFFLLAI
jgi:hypothetical protein